MKVVINTDFGGFSISREAAQFMADRGNKRAAAELAKHAEDGQWCGFGYVTGFEGEYARTDPDLVAAVEALGTKANGDFSRLAIADVPDGVEYEIEEYDGREHIAEAHRTWYGGDE